MRVAWNKGLNKYNDERVAKYSMTNSGKRRTKEQRALISKKTREAMKNPEISKAIANSNKNRVYSKENRERKSEVARKLWENKGYAEKCNNSIYGTKSHYKGIMFMSKVEMKYAEKLDELNIEYETQPGPFKYKSSKDNKLHNYYPDFYLPKEDLYLEIKYLKDLNDTRVIDKLNGMKSLGLKCILLDKKNLNNLDAVIGQWLV